MGKDYMESSLKRFLKRKVKITLGVVVAFLISGNIGLASVIEKQEEEKLITAGVTLTGNIIKNQGNGLSSGERVESDISINFKLNNMKNEKELEGNIGRINIDK